MKLQVILATLCLLAASVAYMMTPHQRMAPLSPLPYPKCCRKHLAIGRKRRLNRSGGLLGARREGKSDTLKKRLIVSISINLVKE